MSVILLSNWISILLEKMKETLESVCVYAPILDGNKDAPLRF